jgi:hypothetical protein
MLKINIKKPYRKWYEKNKERLSAKRKQRYADDPEYRQRAIERSRRHRRGESPAPLPADGVSFPEAALRVGVGISTLREWRSKGWFPEPTRHNHAFWFAEAQLQLLIKLKEFLRKYKMRLDTYQRDEFNQLREFIQANWN